MNGNWKRLASIHCQDEGEIAAVWLAHDKDADEVHLYDCCVFRLEVLAVIAEGLNCRGRWIPIAWESKDKDIADKLLDRGCKMLSEPCIDSDAFNEMTSRDIWERMRTGRFKVESRLKSWLDEYQSYYREDSKIPDKGYPLMTATRTAIAMLDYAKRQQPIKQTTSFPRVAIV